MTKKEIIKRLKQIHDLLKAPNEDETVKECLDNAPDNIYPIACGVARARVGHLLEDLQGK